jgi:hypothetical protein
MLAQPYLNVLAMIAFSSKSPEVIILIKTGAISPAGTVAKIETF